MKRYTAKLYESMICEVADLEGKFENILRQSERAFHIVRSHIEELKSYILKYQYQDRQEEILFFKEVQPKFLCELIYHTEVFCVESSLPVGSTLRKKEHYAGKLDRIAGFFDRHIEFYTYYRIGKTELDEKLFLADPDAPLLFPEILACDLRFCTPATYKIAKIRAYEKLNEYLQSALAALQSGGAFKSTDQPELNWTESKAALIELAYALHSRGAVNSGKAEVKQIIAGLEYLFGVQVGNFYRTFQNMRFRKKDRTPFLNALTRCVQQRMDDTDMNLL